MAHPAYGAVMMLGEALRVCAVFLLFSPSAGAWFRSAREAPDSPLGGLANERLAQELALAQLRCALSAENANMKRGSTE